MAKNSLIHSLNLVVIGGSAGSLDVVLKILPQLQPGSAISIILILHRKNTYDFSLPELLESKTSWSVREAEEKQPLKSDYLYLAPADYHLLVEKDRTLSLDVSEKINFSRPSIDVTFESAAEVYKEKLTAVLLSGANDDGVNGLKKVSACGGFTIVQNPLTAAVAYMPQQAINHVKIDKIMNPEEIGPFINSIRPLGRL